MTFKWLNGEELTFTNWAMNEPSKLGKIQRKICIKIRKNENKKTFYDIFTDTNLDDQGAGLCAVVNPSGFWVVDVCNTNREYICELKREGYTTPPPPTTTTPEPGKTVFFSQLRFSSHEKFFQRLNVFPDGQNTKTVAFESLNLKS